MTQMTSKQTCFICYKNNRRQICRNNSGDNLITTLMKMKCHIPLVNPVPNMSVHFFSPFPTLQPNPHPFFLYFEPVESKAMSPEEALMDRM